MNTIVAFNTYHHQPHSTFCLVPDILEGLGCAKKTKLFKVFQQVSYVRGICIKTSENEFLIFFDMGPPRVVNY